MRTSVHHRLATNLHEALINWRQFTGSPDTSTLAAYKVAGCPVLVEKWVIEMLLKEKLCLGLTISAKRPVMVIIGPSTPGIIKVLQFVNLLINMIDELLCCELITHRGSFSHETAVHLSTMLVEGLYAAASSAFLQPRLVCELDPNLVISY